MPNSSLVHLNNLDNNTKIPSMSQRSLTRHWALIHKDWNSSFSVTKFDNELKSSLINATLITQCPFPRYITLHFPIWPLSPDAKSFTPDLPISFTTLISMAEWINSKLDSNQRINLELVSAIVNEFQTLGAGSSMVGLEYNLGSADLVIIGAIMLYSEIHYIRLAISRKSTNIQNVKLWDDGEDVS